MTRKEFFQEVWKALAGKTAEILLLVIWLPYRGVRALWTWREKRKAEKRKRRIGF
jgi:hypothetical protein